MSVNKSEAVESLKRVRSVPGVEENILKRWSPRAFADHEVRTEDLKKLFEAARWAASSYNEQPWRFLVGHKGDQTYSNIYDSLTEFNQSWAKSAPILILSVGKKTFSGNGNPNRYALHDTGAASANLAIQATALGLHVHSIAGFDYERIRISCNIPADYEIGAIMAIGYLGDVDALPEALRTKELAPRKRKQLNEIVFSEWNQPAHIVTVTATART